MRVLVIPDVHLKPKLFDYAEKILKDGKADIAVCLMDIPDDWGSGLYIEKYERTYDRAIIFAKDFPNTLWCYGNHDISYVWRKLETGYSVYAEFTVITKQRELYSALENKDNLAFVHKVDNVLFCHGGITKAFADELGASNVDEAVEMINSAGSRMLWRDDSPLWLRPQYADYEMLGKDEYTQVVGHTPVRRIGEKNGVISTDVFSTFSDGGQIGESAMLVIDSETREGEKIFVK